MQGVPPAPDRGSGSAPGAPSSDAALSPPAPALPATNGSLLSWLDRVIANLGNGIVLTDWDGRIVKTNAAYRQLVGTPEADLDGRSFAEFVHPADRDVNLALLERLKSGRIPFFEIENRYIRPDGREQWVAKWVSVFPVKGAQPLLFAIVSDATDRRRTDAQLRQSEVRYRAIFDQAPIGIAEVAPDGRFLSVNDALSRIVGRSPDELRTLRFADITHPDDLASDLDQLARLSNGEIETFAMHKRYLRPDGAPVWVNLTVSAVRSDDGDLLHYIGVVEDIQEAKEREAAELRRREQAELTAAVLTGLEDLRTPEAQLQHLVDLLSTHLGDYATVEVTDSDGERIRAIAHRDPNLVATLFHLRMHHALDDSDRRSVHQVALGRPLLITEVPSVLDDMGIPTESRLLFARLDPRSHMAVPMSLGGGVHSALVVGRVGDSSVPFTENDLSFLTDLADRVGGALVAADVRRREHQASLHFQQALLPARLAHAPTVSVCGSYAPAAEMLEVGGDWYDSIELDDGRLLLAVGDVVGHGLEAAAEMGRLRAGLAALATGEHDPGRLLTALDHFASGPLGADFATVVCAVITPDTGEVSYASAGHPPILLIGPTGDIRWLDKATSAPLCSGTEQSRSTVTTNLEPGSTLVLYSDGLVERRNQSLFDGLDRLAAKVSQMTDSPMAGLADRIISEMTKGIDPGDDIAVLAVRFEAASAAAFHFDLDADPAQLSALRRAMRDWLRGTGLDTTSTERAVLVVGEACANAVDHAYLAHEGGAQPITVRQWFDDHGLSIEVRDRGQWRPPGAHGNDRGRGTMIMEALTGRFERASTSGGTVVRMHLPLEARFPAGHASGGVRP
jgi:PAS domain S-box-containing protein